MNRRDFLRYGALGASVALTESVRAAALPSLNSIYADKNEHVGVQLILAMDTSSSMNESEYDIQKRATAQALNSELFRNVIKYKSGETSLAITIIEFDNYSVSRIPWRRIDGSDINDKPYTSSSSLQKSSKSADALDDLTNEIINFSRVSDHGTSIISAIKLSGQLYESCPWPAKEKRVLDVFGDGKDVRFTHTGMGNNDYELREARNNLAKRGVTINGFALVNEQHDLATYFERNLVTKEYSYSEDGYRSEPGRVWRVSDKLGDEQNVSLKAYYNHVVLGMKQKLSVEFADVGTYKAIARHLNDETLRLSLPGLVT